MNIGRTPSSFHRWWGTWYPQQACRFLKLNHHHIHSFVYKDEKSIIDRTTQYIEDGIEIFDDYFPCRKKNKCELKHVTMAGSISGPTQ